MEALLVGSPTIAGFLRSVYTLWHRLAGAVSE